MRRWGPQLAPALLWGRSATERWVCVCGSRARTHGVQGSAQVVEKAAVALESVGAFRRDAPRSADDCKGGTAEVLRSCEHLEEDEWGPTSVHRGSATLRS